MKQKNENIGIMTFWNVPNYGTFAQAYALQKVIAEIKKSATVQQINHLDKYHHDFYYSVIPKGSRKSLSYWKTFVKNIFTQKQIKRTKQLFVENYNTIPHTEELTKENAKNFKFDTVVLGSDIVWDYSIRVFNYDQMLFGLGLNTNKVISYAASFGTVKSLDGAPEYVIEALKKMQNISVRDENSADLVEKVTKNRPQVVLDPALIWDFKTDENIKESKYSNYIAVYGQDFTEEFKQNLVKFAKENNKQLVQLDCHKDDGSWCDVVVKQKDMTPYEWIGLFKGADMIATSTFHGIMFSIIFNKKFAWCKTPFIDAKCDKFLKKLGIYDRFDDKTAVAEMYAAEWDYEKIEKYLNEERKKSIDYLKKAL